MDEKQKLRMLIPYWISHNAEHAQEFRDWASVMVDPIPELEAAALAVETANKSLQEALEALGSED